MSGCRLGHLRESGGGVTRREASCPSKRRSQETWGRGQAGSHRALWAGRCQDPPRGGGRRRHAEGAAGSLGGRVLIGAPGCDRVRPGASDRPSGFPAAGSVGQEQLGVEQADRSISERPWGWSQGGRCPQTWVGGVDRVQGSAAGATGGEARSQRAPREWRCRGAWGQGSPRCGTSASRVRVVSSAERRGCRPAGPRDHPRHPDIWRSWLSLWGGGGQSTRVWGAAAPSPSPTLPLPRRGGHGTGAGRRHPTPVRPDNGRVPQAWRH